MGAWPPLPSSMGTLLTRTPGVYGGRLCLAGHRIPVTLVAILHNEGWTPERIAEEYSQPLPQPYAAVAYYLANKDAVDLEIEENALLYAEGAARERANGLSRASPSQST